MSLSLKPTSRRSAVAPVIVVTFTASFLALATACGGGTSVKPEPDPDPASEAAVGVVEEPPEGAIQVAVDLHEWAVEPEPVEVDAGEVYFLASNTGAEAHEMVLIRTDEAPADLPVTDGRVPEDEVNMIGEIEPFAAHSEASVVFDLEPGNYVLLCNITEEADGGETESHFEQGMSTTFTVN
ncbi:MAG: hypothetical protein WBD55_07980 [Dehalococcoidia bacterium]